MRTCTINGKPVNPLLLRNIKRTLSKYRRDPDIVSTLGKYNYITSNGDVIQHKVMFCPDEGWLRYVVVEFEGTEDEYEEIEAEMTFDLDEEDDFDLDSLYLRLIDFTEECLDEY